MQIFDDIEAEQDTQWWPDFVARNRFMIQSLTTRLETISINLLTSLIRVVSPSVQTALFESYDGRKRPQTHSGLEISRYEAAPTTTHPAVDDSKFVVSVVSSSNFMTWFSSVPGLHVRRNAESPAVKVEMLPDYALVTSGGMLAGSLAPNGNIAELLSSGSVASDKTPHGIEYSYRYCESERERSWSYPFAT